MSAPSAGAQLSAVAMLQYGDLPFTHSKIIVQNYSPLLVPESSCLIYYFHYLRNYFINYAGIIIINNNNGFPVPGRSCLPWQCCSTATSPSPTPWPGLWTPTCPSMWRWRAGTAAGRVGLSSIFFYFFFFITLFLT